MLFDLLSVQTLKMTDGLPQCLRLTLEDMLTLCLLFIRMLDTYKYLNTPAFWLYGGTQSSSDSHMSHSSSGRLDGIHFISENIYIPGFLK